MAFLGSGARRRRHSNVLSGILTPGSRLAEAIMHSETRYSVQLCLALTATACIGCATTAPPAAPGVSAPVASIITTPTGAATSSSGATDDAESSTSASASASELSSLVRSAADPADKSASGPVPTPVALISHNQSTIDGGTVIQPPPGEETADFISTDANRPLTLADFEAMALANNPTIQQLTATTQKAAGYRQQVGLRANPVVGYQGMQIADEGTDQHTAFIEQEIVTGGKLELNRRVLNEAVRAQCLELEAQQQRVRTDIRINFYRALAAQQRVALTTEFQSVGRKGFELAGVRKRAMEASQIEVLQAKIQMNQVDLAKQQAEVASAAAWRELAAMAGNPNLHPVALAGEFNDQIQPIDWTATRSMLLAGSPEYLAAQTRVQQARLFLERQGVQALPNLTVQLASGVDNGTNSGLINLQVAAPIPLFNKNQGNIAAARAEYCRALLEVARIENSIQARLASVSNDFDSALAAVNKYQVEILPSVRETLGLAEEAYRAGEFSFLEVLIVRRTYFESSLQYLDSQVQLAQASAKVDGYVLTGGLDATIDQSGDDGLRGQTFSQQ